jgi:hypothetical protein
MSQSLASGITGAAPIWHTIMSSLLTDTSDEKPTQPADVVSKQCGLGTEYFIKGTETDCGWKFSPSPAK